MFPSSFGIPSGGHRVVRRCSAHLVETYGPDGKCLHQEVIIHRLPSDAQCTITETFFYPLLSHGRGLIQKMSFPSKCSSVITSIYVSPDNPGEFRCGIRAFYPKETIMRAQDAVTQIDSIIDTLAEAKQAIEDNDTYDFDIDRKLNVMDEIATEVNEYILDQT